MCNIVLRNGRGLQGDLESNIKRFESKINSLIMSDLELGIRAKTVREELDIEFSANLLVGVVFQTAYYYFVKKGSKKSFGDIDELTHKITDIFSSVIFVTEN